MKLGIKILHTGAVLPEYQTPGAAGADLHACLESPETIKPGEVKLIGTGLAMEIPLGYELQVRSRSGLAFKHGIVVLNSPGTVDSDYRGELKVMLMNQGKEAFIIEHGERIAQMVIAKHETATFEEVEKLSESTRGTGGFGSTGK